MGLIKIPFKAQAFFDTEYKKIFNSGMLAEADWNLKLANKISMITKSNGCVPVASNGAGLMCLLQLYGSIHNRKKIMLQSNTMYGMFTMSNTSGYEVLDYIPCNIETLMPSLSQVEEALSSNKFEDNELVIMLSHMGGIINPDIEEIAKLCKSKNIILLEDCAHSFGSTFNNKHSGLFGDAGVYSFYSTKAIPAGEGGAIVSNNIDILKYAERYTKYDRFERSMSVGNNIRLSELQALFIYSVVSEHSSIIKNKAQIAEKYIEVCDNLSINYINQEINGQQGNYYKFVIYHPDVAISDYLPKLETKTSGIYDYSLCGSDFIPKHHVCLPIWYEQDQNLMNNAIKELNDCFEEKNK